MLTSIKVLELSSSLLLVPEIFLKFREKDRQVTILCRNNIPFTLLSMRMSTILGWRNDVIGW